MKFSLYHFDALQVDELMSKHRRLAEVFLHLLAVERERKRGQGHTQEKDQIHSLFQKHKDRLKKKSNDPTAINKLRNYICEEEKGERSEWESLILYFESEDKLRSHLEANWGNK